ncbi:MAG TPA: lasso peptide biosynthesis B2 protein [Reyranella sp.]|jgi:hypothetical protein|nr:lasso peptide biosynthesis B2 protein [Reyranella sp.]
MSTVATLFRLSAEDRRLFARAWLALVVARIALSLVDIGRLRRWAARSGSGHRPVKRIVWAVRAAGRRVPGATCLVSSLALQRLLSGNGHASELHIGVARRDGALAAHAWVVCDGEALDSGGSEDAYARLIAWRSAEPT